MLQLSSTEIVTNEILCATGYFGTVLSASITGGQFLGQQEPFKIYIVQLDYSEN